MVPMKKQEDKFINKGLKKTGRCPKCKKPMYRRGGVLFSIYFPLGDEIVATRLNPRYERNECSGCGYTEFFKSDQKD